MTVTVDAAAEVICVKYTEPYTFDEWLACAARVRDDRQAPFNKRMGFLIDRTEVGDLPTAFVASVVSRFAAVSNVMRARRVAIVVSGQEAMQSAWLQAMMYEEAGAVAGVFTCRAEANAWLKEH